MGKTYPGIDPKLVEWIEKQHLFFVATAPLADDGFVNCSPKGLDSFLVVDAHRVAYLDFNGSGVETIAHLRENGRIVIMFCALDGSPKIVRLHGQGRSVEAGDAEFDALRARFTTDNPVRSIIVVDVTRVSDSCGFGVPVYDYVGERDALTRWAASKDEASLSEYQQAKNRHSLDGLPGLKSANLVRES